VTRFRYRFVRNDGVVVEAAADAEDEFTLAAKLRRERGYLLRAWPERNWQAWLAALNWRFGRSSIPLALQELGSLVKAGLPIDRSLSVVSELLPDEGLRNALYRIRDSVRRGNSLADAMEMEKSYFSVLHVNLVRAGEVGNTLSESLLRLADHLRSQAELQGQIQVALIYPMILMLVGVGALILLATVVLPQLVPIFADAGQEMPLPTRIILGASSILRESGWLLTIILALLSVLLRQILRRPKVMVKWHAFKLRLPVIGPLIQAAQIARFARTAGTLLRSGVALSASLSLARQSLTNMAINEAVRIAIIDIRAGRSLTDALKDVGVLPKFTSQLISVGEEGGNLDEMLLHQAELFERSGARRIESLVAILVPFLTILIGTTVAGVLASILLAIMKLNELAN